MNTPDLESLPPEELDALAGEAVGLEPIRWHSKDGSILPGHRVNFVEGHDPWSTYPDLPTDLRAEWPAFSTNPGACSMLKQAASNECGWPFVLQRADDDFMYGAWIQQAPPMVDEEGPFKLDRDEPFVDLRIEVDVSAKMALADTEERAVTLAVARWGIESGRVKLDTGGDDEQG